MMDKKNEVKEAIVVKEENSALVKKEREVQVLPNGSTVEQSIISQLSLAGTIAFTKKQQEILFAEISEEEIEIRPDGPIYLPWVFYVKRLRDAFGGKWSIIPREPKPEMNPDGNGLMWGFYLVIDGKPYGYAIGEQAYFHNNERMSWSDACEGCKSNALMRLCKGIGIGLEMWQPSFTKNWKEKWAERYFDKYRNKKLWRKADKAREEMKDSVEEKMTNTSKSKTKIDKTKTEEVIPPEELPIDDQLPEEQVQKVLSIIGTLVGKFHVDPGYVILFFKQMLEEEFAIGLPDFKIPESLEDRHCTFILDYFRDKKNPNIYNMDAVKQVQGFDPGEGKQGSLI